MHCLGINKSVSNRIPCVSFLFYWTSQPQLGLDGSWCQGEEQPCNRDHTNWYLQSIINDSINIISTSQRFKAPATTAATADGIESLHGSRPPRQAEHKTCWNYSTDIITTSQRSDQLVTPKHHHQRQYHPASSNHYNPNLTHEKSRKRSNMLVDLCLFLVLQVIQDKINKLIVSSILYVRRYL